MHHQLTIPPTHVRVDTPLPPLLSSRFVCEAGPGMARRGINASGLLRTAREIASHPLNPKRALSGTAPTIALLSVKAARDERWGAHPHTTIPYHTIPSHTKPPLHSAHRPAMMTQCCSARLIHCD